MATDMQAQMRMLDEVERFLASQPVPEQITAFKTPPQVTSRFYELVRHKRAGHLQPEEQHELERYEQIEHRMQVARAEAHRQIRTGDAGAVAEANPLAESEPNQSAD